MPEPTHEVWGGYTNSYGDCDDPRHLEDCFSLAEAEKAATEWAIGKDRYAYVRVKDPVRCGAKRCADLGCFGFCKYPARQTACRT